MAAGQCRAAIDRRNLWTPGTSQSEGRRSRRDRPLAACATPTGAAREPRRHHRKERGCRPAGAVLRRRRLGHDPPLHHGRPCAGRRGQRPDERGRNRQVDDRDRRGPLHGRLRGFHPRRSRHRQPRRHHHRQNGQAPAPRAGRGRKSRRPAHRRDPHGHARLYRHRREQSADPARRHRDGRGQPARQGRVRGPGAVPAADGDGSLVKSGTRICWQGGIKRAAVDIWDTAENTPDAAPNLWEDIQYKQGYRLIPETITATLAFAKGERGWWQDELYESLLAANVYTPSVNPDGWKKITEEGT